MYSMSYNHLGIQSLFYSTQYLKANLDKGI